MRMPRWSLMELRTQVWLFQFDPSLNRANTNKGGTTLCTVRGTDRLTEGFEPNWPCVVSWRVGVCATHCCIFMTPLQKLPAQSGPQVDKKSSVSRAVSVTVRYIQARTEDRSLLG